jgi:hypothetical protein
MTSIPQFWDSAIVPTLVDYIRIPAKSPHFDIVPAQARTCHGAGMAKYTKSVYFCAMKNLTITLDEETARLARIRAAERDMSLSRFIGEALRRELRHADDYEAAYRAWRARKPFPLKGSPQPYPKREELYDRPVLRRR